MIEVSLCADATQGADVAYGLLNPDAVALVELLDAHGRDYRRTLAKVTLTFGREVIVALEGAQLASEPAEHHHRFVEFSRMLMQAKSPLAGLSVDD